MLVSDRVTAEEVVRTLSDEYSRRIVLSIVSKSLSIDEISREQAIPISTCYRRIHELLRYGIVKVNRTVIEEDGKKYSRYRAAFKNVSIRFESGEIKVDVIPNIDGSDRLSELWSEVRSRDAKESKETGQTVVPTLNV